MLGQNFIFRLIGLLLSFLFLFSLSAQSEESYFHLITKLDRMEKKIQMKKLKIKGLIEQDKREKDKEKKKKIFAEMVLVHRQMERNKSEYNEIYKTIKFRYPEKDTQTKKKYLPMRRETIEELKNESGMDAVLTRVKEEVDDKYKSFTREDKSLKMQKSKSLEEATDDQEFNSKPKSNSKSKDKTDDILKLVQ